MSDIKFPSDTPDKGLSGTDRVLIDDGVEAGDVPASEFLDTDNHTSGTINKVYTASEKTKLANSFDKTADTTDDITEGSVNLYDKIVALLAGTGIGVTGTYPNFTVTNSSPDQIVSLTEGANITITGTYPNFTITSSGSGDLLSTNNLSDLADIPTARDNLEVYSETETDTLLSAKQDTLVNQTNIKSINGDTLLGSGDLIVTAGAGGFASNLYPTNIASVTEPSYNQLSYTADLTETLVSTVVNSGDGDVLAGEYLFDTGLGVNIIDGGLWDMVGYGYVDNATGVSNIKLEFFTYETDTTENILFTITSPEINNTSVERFVLETTQSSFITNTTDKLGVRVYVSTTSVADRTITYVIGDGNASYFNTPLATRHNQLRGRDEDDQHPISSITDLQTELNSKADISGQIFTGDISATNLSGTNTGDETVDTIGDLINGSTLKNTLEDADEFGLRDNITGDLQKTTWDNIKLKIKAYYDAITSTLTNKTISLTNNTLTGTTAEFNTALTDGDFATLAGSETLTNKTLTDPKITTSINAQTGTTYTLVLTDQSKLITQTNASAITTTVPPNSSVAFPVGTQIDLVQQGAGAITFAEGIGVTINSLDDNLTTNGQYVGVTLIKIGTDEWDLFGNLTT